MDGERMRKQDNPTQPKGLALALPGPKYQPDPAIDSALHGINISA